MFKKGASKAKLERNKYDDRVMEAVVSGDATKLRPIIEKQKYSSLASADTLGRIPIFEAINRGFLEIVKILLDAENQETVTNKDGLTPLHCAAKKGEHEIVTLLLKKSKVDPLDSRGQTPLHYAAISGSKDAVQALIAHQSDTEKKDKNGNTPLLCACLAGQKSSAIALMNACSNINATNRQEKSPLILASERGLVEVVRMLLQRGAQPDVRDTAGKSARFYAEKNGHALCVALLPEDVAKPKEVNQVHAAPVSRPGPVNSNLARKTKQLEDVKKELGEERQQHEVTKAELQKVKEQLQALASSPSNPVDESVFFAEDDQPDPGMDISSPSKALTHEQEIKILKKRIGAVVVEKKQLEAALEEAQKPTSDNEEITNLRKRIAQLEDEVEEAHGGLAMVPAVVLESVKKSSEAKIKALEEQLQNAATTNGGTVSSSLDKNGSTDELIQLYRSLLIQAVQGTLDEDVKGKVLSLASS